MRKAFILKNRFQEGHVCIEIRRTDAQENRKAVKNPDSSEIIAMRIQKSGEIQHV